MSSVTRRTVLSGLAAAAGLSGAVAGDAAVLVRRYWASLAKADGGYGWADETASHLTVTFAAVASYRVLGEKPPHPAEVARFVRDAYPLPPYRSTARPMRRFDYERIQGLLWLDEPVDTFREVANSWTGPSYYSRLYEWRESPILQQEARAILTRRLLELLPTLPWQEYIASRRRPNGSFSSTPAADRSEGHVTNTLWGLQAMSALAMPIQQKEQTAEWIRACQVLTGGFSFMPEVNGDNVDTTWAALKCLQLLNEESRNPDGARKYLLSLWNEDGGFGDRPGRLSNPLASWQALEALACLGPVKNVETTAKRRIVRREFPSAPSRNLKIYSMQMQAPGLGHPQEAVDVAKALKIDLWGARNAPEGWIEQAQRTARKEQTPVTFFVANAEYGTYVTLPGLGAYSGVSNVAAAAGQTFGRALSRAAEQPVSLRNFLLNRVRLLKEANGELIWRPIDNEEYTRILLDQAVEQGTYAAITGIAPGDDTLQTHPYLNRYRDALPFLALQDARARPWWWMDWLTGFRTLFLAKEPTWNAWQEALRHNWVLAVRHDETTKFRTEVAGGSNAVRDFVLERQSQWRWWGDDPKVLTRPWASLIAVRPDDLFEYMRPKEGVLLRLRCWWETDLAGVPRNKRVEFVSLEVDGQRVQTESVRVELTSAGSADVYYQWAIPASQAGPHKAVATVKLIRTGETAQVAREFMV